MLKYIRFNNFYSFLDETELSFIVGKQPSKSTYDIELNVANNKDNTRLNKVLAVVGANGSGKSQLLKSLAFVSWFLVHSIEHQSPIIPFQTFALNQKSPSYFELGLLVPTENSAYQEYRYELEIVEGLVKREALYHKTSSNFSYIFERSYTDGTMSYKHKGFIKPSLANDIKASASLINLASYLDNAIALQLVAFAKTISTNLNFQGRINNSNIALTSFAELLSTDQTLKKQTEQLLCQFDTGIQELNFKKVLVMTDKGQEEVMMPFGIHHCDHSQFEKIFLEESNGTQSAFMLLGKLLPILALGGVAVIDEIDNDLHPLLLPVILDLFKFSETNPHNAQLVFSCHTPEVLNHLQKHQVYLVQKDNQQSEAWRLDEVVGVRSDDNLYAKYMSGAFDAIPRV